MTRAILEYPPGVFHSAPVNQSLSDEFAVRIPSGAEFNWTLLPADIPNGFAGIPPCLSLRT